MPTSPPQPTAKPGKTYSFPVPVATAKSGGGGTYVYTSGSAARMAHVSAPVVSAPNALPRTGGASGDGGNPSSPLAPLALLAGVAIVAGRMLPRLFKR